MTLLLGFRKKIGPNFIKLWRMPSNMEDNTHKQNSPTNPRNMLEVNMEFPASVRADSLVMVSRFMKFCHWLKFIKVCQHQKLPNSI